MGKRKKKAVRGREEPGHVIISDKRCLKSSRFILFLHSQRCTTWPWASQEASSLECELDHTDSPQTDWLMGCLSLPVKHKKKKKRSNELTASSTSRSRKQLDTYCMENKILTLPPAAPRGWLVHLDGLAWHLAQTFITHPHRMNCSNSGDPSSFVFFYLIISGGHFSPVWSDKRARTKSWPLQRAPAPPDKPPGRHIHQLFNLAASSDHNLNVSNALVYNQIPTELMTLLAAVTQEAERIFN